MTERARDTVNVMYAIDLAGRVACVWIDGVPTLDWAQRGNGKLIVWLPDTYCMTCGHGEAVRSSEQKGNEA